MSGSGPVYVDDAGRPGSRIALRIDADGDIEFSEYLDSDIWITPADLIAALKELGVLPDDADKPRERRIEPSERVRESWRRAAAEDANERPKITAYTAERRIKLRAAELRDAERARREAERARREDARPRFFRDRDGDVWRALTDGRLILHSYAGADISMGNAEAYAHADVVRAWGPLTEIPDPARVGTPPDGLTAEYIRQLREAARQDITRSVWRDFS